MPGRPLRADAERTVQAILEAAENVLSGNPSASMEQIAEAAGVARTTVHRRFATREALVEAMTEWATLQFADAVDAARPESTPPLVALYQVTANVLRVKIGWIFAMSRSIDSDSKASTIHAQVLNRCVDLFRRCQEAEVFRPDVDLEWAQRVYYALIDEATRGHPDGSDPDKMATVVVDTLLRGIGAPGEKI